MKITGTHGAAPKALLLVSERIAAKLFVITATKRLISQKLRTIIPMIKNRQDTKKSESITEYINVDHCSSVISPSETFIRSEKSYTISACDDYNLKGRGIDYVKTFK